MRAISSICLVVAGALFFDPFVNAFAFELDPSCDSAIEDGLQRLIEERLSVEHTVMTLRRDDAPEGREHYLTVDLIGANTFSVMNSPAILTEVSQIIMTRCETLGLVSFSPGPRGAGGDYVLQFGIFPDYQVRQFECANKNSRDLDVELVWGQKICL